MMGYVFNNPFSVFNNFNSFTEKILQGQKYEENEEFFVQGIEHISFTTQRVDVQLRTYPGSTLKVVLHGKVPRFEQGPFILQVAERNNLRIEFQEPFASQWMHMTVNGEEKTIESDAQLRADIYLPQSYKNKVSIEAEKGEVKLLLPEDQLYELDLQSVSGKIENHLKQKPTAEIQPEKVGHINVRSTEGSISIEPLN